MVSPPDANGRLLEAISGFDFGTALDLFPTELASPSEGSIVYEAYVGPLVSPQEPNGNFDIYEAQRSSQGWKTARRISPSGPQSVTPTAGGVSSDHDYAFTHPILVPGPRPSGVLTGELGADYLSKPNGSFQLTGVGSLGSEPLAQGRYISPGGEHVIFSTGKLEGQSYWCKAVAAKCKVKQLEPSAAPTGTGTIYDREADGSTHVVSLLPGEIPQTSGQQAFYQGASKNGTSIAFEIGGVLYVRVNSGKEASEETEEAPAGAPVYAGLSEDGKYLFYVSGGQKGTIHRFETETEIDEGINPTAEGEVVNVSADGSHVYFLSEEQIGGLGAAGQSNLYDWSGGTTELVATVAPTDTERTSGTLNGECTPSVVCGIPALTRWTSYAVVPINQIEKGPGADSSRAT
ncbi:MAG TPA: hypothetical protein VNN15_03345, partial [Solirubrobacterales bacterium]|nr:hypothetical protein [Solirubrobacterales bacterium]